MFLNISLSWELAELTAILSKRWGGGTGVMWDKHLWNTQRGTLWWKCIVFKRDGRPARWSVTGRYPVSEWTCQHLYVKMSMDVRSQTFHADIYNKSRSLWILFIPSDTMKVLISIRTSIIFMIWSISSRDVTKSALLVCLNRSLVLKH